MPLVSIYGTVYNNAYVIEDSISSLRRALPDFEENYELVIVDNYSNDGTWEKLLRLKRTMRNVRLLRCRCSRGKGRNIALQHTVGDYVMYVDFDCIFAREIGIIVERLRRICTNGEIWNFGFSARKTMVEQVGGWKDLNFGEDWELLGRAIKRNVKLNIIGVKSPIHNIRLAKGGVYGEKRYAQDLITYVLRRVRNLRDTAIGWGLNPAHVIYSINLRRPSALVLLFFSAIYSLANITSGDINSSPIKCQVYTSTRYLLPEEVGLPREWLYILWEDIDQTWPAITKHIRGIAQRTKVYFALLPYRKLLACFRNFEVFKECLKEYAFSTSYKNILKIVLKG